MISVGVQDPSQVAEARRAAVDAGHRNDFDDATNGRIAIVATELATNLVKHGSGGEILIDSYDDEDGTGVSLIALDRGRGIANPDVSIQDGYSTSGTSGHGLGAVVRQSQLFEIASWPGVGTGVMARLSDRPTERTSVASWGGVSVPKPGEVVCGDSWSVSRTASKTLIVADGLGHGPQAAEASVEAVRLFGRFNGHQVPTLLDYVHGGLRATRGAAVSIARLDRDTKKVIYSGIGNVAGIIVSNGELKRMVSMAGTAGHNARKIQAFEYPFESGFVIMHSDGLLTNWTLERYPGLEKFHPSLIAAILYRDLTRARDDSTVVVAKW